MWSLSTARCAVSHFIFFVWGSQSVLYKNNLKIGVVEDVYFARPVGANTRKLNSHYFSVLSAVTAITQSAWVLTTLIDSPRRKKSGYAANVFVAKAVGPPSLENHGMPNGHMTFLYVMIVPNSVLKENFACSVISAVMMMMTVMAT